MRYLEECTFQPKIKDLPSAYGNDSRDFLTRIPFLDRAAQWRAKKDADIERMRSGRSTRVFFLYLESFIRTDFFHFLK